LGLVSKSRLLHLFGVGAVIWLFALTVGGEVPVIRAAIMLTVFLLARTFYRPGTGANAFALTLVVLLIWRPADLFEASFQLTTVSGAAILLIA
ncbi:ComEC/Rec2 family competence protein, partial [Vibrio parahaemolyticus]|uniref:ComEC/Rec2 family competence protein n=1 Tax=Vibrio parahaemolyticus TaxID=670 RepID=UPI001A8EE0B0